MLFVSHHQSQTTQLLPVRGGRDQRRSPSQVGEEAQSLASMIWKRKISGRCREEETTTRERLIQQAAADPDGGRGSCKGCCGVPRGCVAVLVGGGDEGEEERVVVDVRALGQPCVRALLDMAAREFGYDQKGVLRIPCAAAEFRRAVAADSRRPCGR